MTWLNNVLAVPTIGIEIEQNLKFLSDYSTIFAPLIQRVSERDGAADYGYEPLKNLSIRSSKGLGYSFTVNNLVVKFNYALSQQTNAGMLPIFDVHNNNKLYTDILQEILQELQVVIEMVSESKHTVSVKRIGVVASASLTLDSAPPGISELIKHLSSLWKKDLIKSETILTPLLLDTDSFQERCHHTLKFDFLSNPEAIDVVLDWQKVFKEPVDLVLSSGAISECKDKALEYFEKVAAGDF
ncbi:hypothetical protein D0962_18920 [Leptolyngbyaceae cyanobacterium CCMR0082]|uniref:Uncharacterized protein n=1 Tax=Adonisia turfae CCMR0082 TaxID=2304604 RepID=A0A6M0S8M3_9CYAN|nr:hypothetical protein [Adonisia turfae]NEZ64834.1 hypothetical protein [Adonisia turfae CCMR0082]